MKTCPDCIGEIPDEASVCGHCGERVEGKRCTDCGTRCWNEARKCRECGYEFEAAASGPDFEPFSVEAEFLATVLLRGRFLRQRIRFTAEKILVSTPGVFNLSKRDEEIPWKKVAGFDYRSSFCCSSSSTLRPASLTAA